MTIIVDCEWFSSEIFLSLPHIFKSNQNINFYQIYTVRNVTNNSLTLSAYTYITSESYSKCRIACSYYSRVLGLKAKGDSIYESVFAKTLDVSEKHENFQEMFWCGAEYQRTFHLATFVTDSESIILEILVRGPFSPSKWLLKYWNDIRQWLTWNDDDFDEG